MCTKTNELVAHGGSPVSSLPLAPCAPAYPPLRPWNDRQHFRIELCHRLAASLALLRPHNLIGSKQVLLSLSKRVCVSLVELELSEIFLETKKECNLLTLPLYVLVFLFNALEWDTPPGPSAWKNIVHCYTSDTHTITHTPWYWWMSVGEVDHIQ